MANALIGSCYERGIIDYWARETLLAKYSGSPRKLITIAKNILNDNYLEELKKTLQLAHERKAKLPDLFNNLFSLKRLTSRPILMTIFRAYLIRVMFTLSQIISH